MVADELKEFREEMREGFRQVNSRLDRVNGRLDKQGDQLSEHTADIAVLDQITKNLNNEVFVRPTRAVLAPVVTTGQEKVAAETIVLSITPKMWALLAAVISGLSVFAPVIAEWFKRTLS